MIFHGRFVPPLFSRIPCEGVGSIELDVNGLRVRGVRARSIVERIVALFTRARRMPFLARYEWRKLGDVRVRGDVAVVRLTSGALYFRPDDGADALKEMLDFARGNPSREDVTRIAA